MAHAWQLHGTCMALTWQLHASPWKSRRRPSVCPSAIPWRVHGKSMVIPSRIHGNSMALVLRLHGNSMQCHANGYFGGRARVVACNVEGPKSCSWCHRASGREVPNSMSQRNCLGVAMRLPWRFAIAWLCMCHGNDMAFDICHGIDRQLSCVCLGRLPCNCHGHAMAAVVCCHWVAMELP